MKYLTATFVGQRPSLFKWGYDEESEDCQRLKRILFEQIKALINNGVTVFTTGMFLGIDTFSAEMVLDLRDLFPQLGIKLMCVLPYEEQAAKWTSEQRERYFNVLERADSVKYIEKQHTPDCMDRCRYWLIEHSHFVVAVHNGEHKGHVYKECTRATNLKKAVITVRADKLAVIPFTVSDVKI